MTPEDNLRHRAIRSFVVRAGRMTVGQDRAWQELWPRFGLETAEFPLDLPAIFGRDAARTLEIGFGNGESLVALAASHPERDFLGIEVHRPGVGHHVRFTTTSVGGKRAVQTLAAEIAAQVDKDPTKPVPIVRLKKEHYQHKTYGKIYTPMFVVQSWMDMSGAAEPEVEDAADEEPAPAQEAPRRRRAV